MRVPPVNAFHVGCPYTSRAVCYCTHGTPAALQSPFATLRYSQQARAAWDFWQDPAGALGSDEAVEVLVSVGVSACWGHGCM